MTNTFSDFVSSRIPSEKAERSPLKPLQSANCNGLAITIKAPANQRLYHTSSESHLPSSGKALSAGQINGRVEGKEWPVVNGKATNDKMEEGKTPIELGSKFSCEWTKAASGDRSLHEESRGEHKEEEKWEVRREGELKDEENTEQKLYNIASELLQTERAYVARLHLLDQVSVVICCGSFPKNTKNTI